MRIAVRTIGVGVLAAMSAGAVMAADTADATSSRKPRNPALVAIEDVPGLPRVLLIGDSISIGYTLPTRALLAGKANVHRIPANGGPTTRGLENLDRWLGESTWDVIHFNFGLHDLKHADARGNIVDVDRGPRQVDPDAYRENLRRIVARLKRTGARLIWCTTTPIPPGAKGRVPGDELEYNAVAAEVMRDEGIEVNDLHAFAAARLAEIGKPADVHYTPEGSEALAAQVAERIAAALPGSGPRAAEAGRRPNIVLVLVDDFGYECVGANGGESYRTPVLDRLAAGGMRFEQCHCLPLCTPTRVQLMTGLSNRRNYTRFGHLDPTQKTFANHLRDAGYATCVVGKWQLGNGFEGPALFGFDEYCLWQLTRKPGRYRAPGLEIDGREVDFPDDTYGPDVMNDHALDFIGRCKDRPFLLYYPLTLVHTPLEPTPDSPDGIGGRRGPDTFAEMVAYADTLVGTVVEALDRHGLRENTLLMVLGDNGTARGTVTHFQGRDVVGGKGRTTVRGTLVPAIVNWPGTVPAGGVCRDLVDSTDVMPTILEAAGVEIAADAPLDGRSFLPQVRGEPGRSREWIYAWYGPDGGATPRAEFAFDTAFKLYADGRFYDIAADEDEQRPLARESLAPPAAAALDKLTGALARFAGPRPDHFVRQADPARGAGASEDDAEGGSRPTRRGKARGRAKSPARAPQPAGASPSADHTPRDPAPIPAA